jgi:hypothetical protein
VVPKLDSSSPLWVFGLLSWDPSSSFLGSIWKFHGFGSLSPVWFNSSGVGYFLVRQPGTHLLLLKPTESFPLCVEKEKVSGSISEIVCLLLCRQLPEGMLERGQVSSYDRVLALSSGKRFLQVLCSAIRMDHGHPGRCPLCEITDIHRALRRQEDYITDNKNFDFLYHW